MIVNVFVLKIGILVRKCSLIHQIQNNCGTQLLIIIGVDRLCCISSARSTKIEIKLDLFTISIVKEATVQESFLFYRSFSNIHLINVHKNKSIRILRDFSTYHKRGWIDTERVSKETKCNFRIGFQTKLRILMYWSRFGSISLKKNQN